MSLLDTRTSNTLTVLRLPLAFLIVAGHSNILMFPLMKGNMMIHYDSSFIKYPIHLLSQILFTSSVPLFFIISGYLFFIGLDKFDNSVYIVKIKKRIKTLLLPYLIWNAIYWIEPIIEYLIKGTERGILWYLECLWMVPSQVDRITLMNMTTPIDPPLWFLRDLFVSMLLTPCLYYFLKNRYSGLIFVAVLFIPWFMDLPCMYPLPGISIPSLLFFSIGGYLSINKANIKFYLGSRQVLTTTVICLLLSAAAELMTFDYVVRGESSSIIHNHLIFKLCTLSGSLAYPTIAYGLIRDRNVSGNKWGGGILRIRDALVVPGFRKDNCCTTCTCVY